MDNKNTNQIAEIIRHLVISGTFAEEAERYNTERDCAISESMSYSEESRRLAEVDQRAVERLLMAFGIRSYNNG